MARIVSSGGDDGPPRMMRIPSLPALPGPIKLIALAPLLILAGFFYWWFVQRVEVPAGQVLVLVHKWGAPLPEQAGTQYVLHPALLKQLGEPAESLKFKGLLYNVSAEGRYFRDPFFYERILVPATFIEQQEIGVVIRLYGDPLPAGKVVATEPSEAGPLAETLKPGRYNLNPFAYAVKRVGPVFVPEGHVGVQTLRSGTDPENPNRYVVQRGERGVQPDVLPPGMYYKNPYLCRVDAVDVRSHTLDLRGKEAITFPSNDSFRILIEGTVEYAVRQDQAPYVLVAIGDHDDIKDKLILPYMRSLARIEGSKLQARDFISGDMREIFQRRVFEDLREQSYAQGIEIRAALIRRIDPPSEIAGPISERQVAGQQIRQYENEIKVADSQAQLVEQQELQKQNQEIGKINREAVAITIDAEQRKAVALTQANQQLEVARLELEAAKADAESAIARGTADAEIIRLGFEAQSRPLAAAVHAFGGGQAYAQFTYFQKLAPALKSVMATTDGPFAEIFRQLGEPPVAGSAPVEPRGAAPEEE